MTTTANGRTVEDRNSVGTAAVDECLAEFFADKRDRADAHGARYARLWSELAIEATGGKRFRPELVVRTADACGAPLSNGVVRVAAAFELLHTAFVMHDDVIDGDTTRRGRSNLLARMAARDTGRGYHRQRQHWGQTSAILGGDLLIHGAQSMVVQADIDPRTKIDILELFDRVMFTTAAGELEDVAFDTIAAPHSIGETFEMSRWKTAEYSFQGPLVAGALLAAAGTATTDTLDEIGSHLGIAFQLRDDVLGAFGDPDVTGKPADSDLRHAVMTPLLFAGLSSDTDGELLALVDAARAGRSSDTARMRGLLQSSGAVHTIERHIVAHIAEARSRIASPEIPAALKRYLVAIADRHEERDT